MRTQFNQDLSRIQDNIKTLGEQANQAASRAVNALLSRNFQEAREVKRSDISTDQLRYEVENACLILIATQQPVARDLRVLAATTFVAVELERCGDYAKGVAKAARRISRANADVKPYNLPQMDTNARSMLERAVRAFIQGDAAAAHQVIDDDNRVDALYSQLLDQVMAEMADKSLPIESGMWLLHAGHCLERYADRATNIAERVLFVDSGVFTGDLNVNTRNLDSGKTPT
jgi:phosphate transport system protein